MNCEPAYARNSERFESFYALQKALTCHLARHPSLIARWLKSQSFRGEGSGPKPGVCSSRVELAQDAETDRAEKPRGMPEGTSSGRRKPGASSRLSKIGSMNCTVPAKAGPSKNWRTSRLNLARRRELKALVSGTAENKRGEDALGPWLLSAMPVHTYLEITDLAVPNLRAIDPAADDCRRQLIRMRDSLFGANFGLVRNAAMNPGSRDYNERLSAASRGLLDAIDRYVPGPRAARFSYFASYWIRYHVSRHAQKFDSLISFPINQQRIGRQIERHLDECSANGKQPPSLAQLCAEMGISLDAYYWSRCRPKVVSMHDCAGSEHGSCTFEHLLLDPGPEPYDALDQRETAAQLKSLLRAHVCPETRIMLAYVRGIGALSEAAQDHLDQLRESARTRLGKLAEGLRCHHQTRHPALLDPQSRIDTLSACRMPIQSPSLLPD